VIEDDELNCGLQPAAAVFDILPIERADPICTRTRIGDRELIHFVASPEKADVPKFCEGHPGVEWHMHLGSLYFADPSIECERKWFAGGKHFDAKPDKKQLAELEDGGAE
jgi:hypothetical protein